MFIQDAQTILLVYVRNMCDGGACKKTVAGEKGVKSTRAFLGQ